MSERQRVVTARLRRRAQRALPSKSSCPWSRTTPSPSPLRLQGATMCDHTSDPGGREAAMIVLDPGTPERSGRDGVWCDPCLADLVGALNAAGLRTVTSCCGHGTDVGSIVLADGRELVIRQFGPTADPLDRDGHTCPCPHQAGHPACACGSPEPSTTGRVTAEKAGQHIYSGGVLKPLPAPAGSDQCPRCHHAMHEGNICLNMASDNDCSCPVLTTGSDQQ